MEPKCRKKGFAMLEVMIIIMVFMVLAASLLATAGAVNRRAVKRATNNEAYYAALAAVKMMAGEVMNTDNNQANSAAYLLTSGSGLERTKCEIEIELNKPLPPDYIYLETKRVPVWVSSKAIWKKEGSEPVGYLVLSAEATVGEQTENVSMTLKKQKSYVPDYPYGCGVMGNLSLKMGSSFYGGPDVDLYLTGYHEVLGTGEDEAQGGIKSVGGNLIADMTTFDQKELQLKKAKIGGMIISNGNLSLEGCVVGSPAKLGAGNVQARRGGINTTGNLSLTNCDIYGDVYANVFRGNGEELIKGYVNYLEWNRENYTVWDSEKEPHNTSEDEYRRNGEIIADGLKKIVNTTSLKDHVPKREDVFVPQTDGVSEEGGMKVIHLKDEDQPALMEIIAPGSQTEGKPIDYIIVMEKGTKLYITPGIWNVYIYGEGTVDIQSDGSGPVVIYGGIQAEEIEVANGVDLKVYHGKPANEAFRTPSSAVGFKAWTPVDYDMTPSQEVSGNEEEK